MQNKNSDGSIKCAAAEALGEIKDVGSVDPLIKYLKEGFSYLRRDAAIALGKIGDSHAVPALINALKDTENMVWSAAGKAIGEIKDANSAEMLINALNDCNEYGCEIIATSLSKNHGANAVNLILAASGLNMDKMVFVLKHIDGEEAKKALGDLEMKKKKRKNSINRKNYRSNRSDWNMFAKNENRKYKKNCK